MYTYLLDIYDIILSPIYFLLIILLAYNYQKKMEKKNPIYKFFSAGLFVKIIGGISVVLIYIYYYKDGGDTINYYRSSLALINMASKISIFFLQLFSEICLLKTILLLIIILVILFFLVTQILIL
jgi:hypothetical protein